MDKVINQAEHSEQVSEKRRKEEFAKQLRTRIWDETPSASNPYLAESCRCYGYDLFELLQYCRYSEVVYLLFRGELPDDNEAILLEQLQIALINPGIRHAAGRAAVYAGVGKTDPAHILPIGLSVLGGEHLGGSEVEQAMRFLRRASKKSPTDILQEQIIDKMSMTQGDHHPVPGFGSHFGDIDPFVHKLAKHFQGLPASGQCLEWGERFAQELAPHHMGWLITGLVAAILADLGFQPRSGAGLYQLLCAPGLLAHGLEYANKPLSAVPFIDDKQYYIEPSDG